MKLRSERLLITDLSLAYLNEIHQLHSLPEVDEFNTLGIPASIQVTKELILDWLEKKEAIPRMSYVGLGRISAKPFNYWIRMWYLIHHFVNNCVKNTTSLHCVC